MIEHEEHFVNDDVRKVMDSISKYQAERDFTSLMAWQKAREVKLFFYNKILPRLPKEEKYNLNIQIRKAAVSSTSNIAEGYGRFHYQEGIQFYRISRGSLFELKDHLIRDGSFRYDIRIIVTFVRTQPPGPLLLKREGGVTFQTCLTFCFFGYSTPTLFSRVQGRTGEKNTPKE